MVNHESRPASPQRDIATHADGCSKLQFRDSSTTHRHRFTLFRLVEAAKDKDLTQEVTQDDIAASLQRKVDAPLDEFIFAFDEGVVKGLQVARLDGFDDGGEEFLDSGTVSEEGVCGEDVGCEKAARDEIGQYAPAVVSNCSLHMHGGLAYSICVFASLWQSCHACVRCFSA